VAGYEDANDADRLRHDPTLQIVADHKLATFRRKNALSDIGPVT
jgi:hypothetical protein